MSNQIFDIYKCGAISRDWYIFVVNGETSVMYASDYYLPNKPLMNGINQHRISPDNYIGSISEGQLKMLQACKLNLTVGDVLNVIQDNRNS